MSVEITRNFALRMLSLEEGFTVSELKAAYLKKAKIYHPDAGGSHEEFLNLGAANELLSNFPTPKSQAENDTLSEREREYGYYEYRKESLKEKLRRAREEFTYLLINLLTNKNYLVKALTAQALMLSYKLYLEFKIEPLTRSYGWFIAISFIYICILATLASFTLIIAIFYSQKLSKKLKLDHLEKRKLYNLRNITISTFTFLTLPAYLTYLLLLGIVKVLGKLANKI